MHDLNERFLLVIPVQHQGRYFGAFDGGFGVFFSADVVVQFLLFFDALASGLFGFQGLLRLFLKLGILDDLSLPLARGVSVVVLGALYGE